MGSRCGSAVKWWNEKLNESKRPRVHSPARANLFFKEGNKNTPMGWKTLKSTQHKKLKKYKLVIDTLSVNFG
jgi:hypothetical protein